MLYYLLSPVIAEAAFEPEGWAWKTVINTPQSAETFVALPLDGPIYDGLLNPPNDLRLVDRNHALTPHLIRCGRTAAASEMVARPVRLLNRTYEPLSFSRVVLDFGQNGVKNRIKVELSGENYYRKAMIEGGNDGVQWEKIADSLPLFDMAVDGKSHKVDTLGFPENTFRYLRLTIKNVENDTRQIEILNASAFYEEQVEEAQLVQIETVGRNIEQDEKTKSTVIELDLGYRHMPLHSISLDVEDALFHRAYTIEGRNTIKHKIRRRTEEAWRAEEVETRWNPASRGIVYRRQDEGKVAEATGDTLARASYRFLRITIKNGDDAPLRIKDITVDRKICALVFEPRPGNQYVLYGGNIQAGPPSYDFSRVAPDMDIAALPQAGHGPIEPLQPQKSQIPWSERYWYVITAAVILAVALMLWIIFPALRREMKTDGGS